MDLVSKLKAVSLAAPANCEAAPPNQPESSSSADTRFAARRRWPRFAVDMPVHVRVTTQGPTRTVTCEGQGMDVSVGGLAVVVDIDLAVGAQISVEFTPPYASEPIAFRCFVRNREGRKYGVEFITENDRDYQNLGELRLCLEGAPVDSVSS